MDKKSKEEFLKLGNKFKLIDSNQATPLDAILRKMGVSYSQNGVKKKRNETT